MGLPAVRYEVLPFGTVAREACALARPVPLTVTCSPRLGIDQTVDFAVGLRGLGHPVVCHVAARMVKGEAHIEELLGRMQEAGIHEVFLVGGDQREPLGPYRRGLDLLPVLKQGSGGLWRVGVPAYPEGHPRIGRAGLDDDIRQKAQLADYMVTQMCFDPQTIIDWLDRTRAQGIELPALLGIPGIVARGRLLEVSLRTGVGSSVSFLRKQNGVAGRMFGRGKHEGERLYQALAPLVGHELGVAGLHAFTFNRLADTYNFVESQRA